MTAPAALASIDCQSGWRRLMSPERRLVALCDSAHLKSWIEGEVGDLVASRHYAPTVRGVLGALGRGGASKCELLVLDLDLLAAPGVYDLHTGLEELWWHGTMIGLGSLRGLHRRYLEIERSIPRPFGSEALRALVARSDFHDHECGGDTQPLVAWPTGRS